MRQGKAKRRGRDETKERKCKIANREGWDDRRR